VIVQGNELTQQKVVRRRVENYPDRWLDGTKAKHAERRLRASRLFDPGSVAVTIQPENETLPGYRDVLVQVAETNTGSFNFGAAANTDFGFAGLISLNQRNFDLYDTPDSFDEFIRGRAFRGGGQDFSLAAQPGSQRSVYSLTFSEPYLLDSDYGLRSSLFLREREFRDYEEERVGTTQRIGRSFGTRWSGGITFRVENIEIEELESDATMDLFDVEGESFLTAVGIDLSRTTIDNIFRPTKGTRTRFGVQQFGALGGDFEFTKLNFSHSLFLTVDEDFLGRETVLTVETRIGYIPQENEAPIFERFYLGGRTLRGFEFRGVGPVGIRQDNGMIGDDHVGGEFSFFFGLEIQKPVYRNLVAVVGFIDSGALNNEVSFDDYRVSVGVEIGRASCRERV